MRDDDVDRAAFGRLPAQQPRDDARAAAADGRRADRAGRESGQDVDGARDRVRRSGSARVLAARRRAGRRARPRGRGRGHDGVERQEIACRRANGGRAVRSSRRRSSPTGISTTCERRSSRFRTANSPARCCRVRSIATCSSLDPARPSAPSVVDGARHPYGQTAGDRMRIGYGKLDDLPRLGGRQRQDVCDARSRARSAA